MAKILTSNVVISKYKESLDNLFTSDVIDFNSVNADKFLVSPKKNKYLTSLEYEINYSSDSHGFLNLVFADIDGKFEQEYLSPSKDVMSQIIEKSIDSRNWASISDTTLKTLCRDTVYVSFGTGDRARNWSAPAAFELYNAFIEVDDGFRYYKLSYVPVNNPLFMKDLMLDSSEVNPKKQKIPFDNTNHLLNLKVNVGDNDSFSRILEKFYKEYLQRLCNTNNVIVLIPDGIDQFIIEKAPINKQKQREIFAEYFFIDLVRPKPFEPDPVVTTEYPAKNSIPNSNVPRFELDDPTKTKSKTMVATFNLQKINSNTEFNILDINIFQPINSLSFGIQTCLKISDTVSVRTDNVSQNIKKFKEFGLIKNGDSGRCIILGIDKQINELIYQNYYNVKKSTEPTINLFEESEVKKILEGEGFKSAIRDLTRKRKHSSGFEEALNLDELTIDANAPGQNRSKAIDPVVDELVKVIKKYEDTDMPVFTHNMKNSNVLSINIENKTNTYINALNFAVEEDFYNKLIEETKSESGLKNIEAYKIIEDKADKIIETVTKILESAKTQPVKFPAGAEDAQQIYDQMVQNKEDTKNLNLILKYTIIHYFNAENFTNTPERENIIQTIVDHAYTILTLLQHKKYLISIQSLAGRDTSDFRRAAIFQRLFTVGSPDIKIKTLPYFHLADYNTVAAKYSILLSKKTIAKISPNNTSLNDLVNYLDYFSGLYCIVGFKHTVNPNGSYSEFRLKKRYLETA
jgi:hypothetical protein